MMAEFGVFTVLTTKLCHWCGARVDIEVESHSLDDLPTDLVKQMHADGWVEGCCPECAANPRVLKALARERDAEDITQEPTGERHGERGEPVTGGGQTTP